MKENKYDDAMFFDQYSRMSRSVDGLNGAGEWHALRSVLPELKGKRILDLGCGYGWHCKYAIEQGACRVVGVDLSCRMIERARTINADPCIDYRVMAVEDFDYEVEQFDVVVSSLTFHYLESFDQICQNVRRCLVDGGAFVFSVEHPVFTAQGRQEWIYDAEGRPLYWPVDRYFDEGVRNACFLGSEVTKYHKTVATYLGGLLNAGFEITAFVEPMPDEQMLGRVEGMEDELRRPMMMIVGAKKLSGSCCRNE